MSSKNCVVKFRASQAERDQLAKRAEAIGLTVSDYCRAALASPTKRPRKARHVQADPALLRELQRIGNNLNQIAHAIHSERFRPSEVVEVITLVREFEHEITALKALATPNQGPDDAS